METDDDPAFHGSEAISAVQDVDQYYGDDDDFDDLYNDVNVGDGFFNSSHQTPPLPQIPLPPPPPQHNQPHQLPPPQSPMAVPHSLPPPPPLSPSLQQQPPMAAPNSLPPPPPPQAPPLLQKVNIPGMVAPPPILPPPPNLPPPPQPPVAPAPPPPRHHQIQQGGDGLHRQGGNFSGGPIVVGNGGAAGSGEGPGGMPLFVGDLHWWTTDAELEAELSKYGLVKEVRFFDEKASGKSKGYCQVDFFDPNVVSVCKEGMNGHLFHGRPCVVAFSSPNLLRRMGESQGKNHQSMAAQTLPMQLKAGRGPGGAGGPQVGTNHGGGRVGGPGGGNWGRTGGGIANRGPAGNMRNRVGPTGGRGIMGNGAMVPPPPPMLPPGGMMGQGFDPSYGAMGRMGAGFGGFPGPGPGPFPGMMQRLINSTRKGEAMGKRGHSRGSGLVHRRRDGKGRRICPQHRIGQRGGTVMIKTWAETGIVTMAEIGREIVTGRGKKPGKGIGTGMTETAIAIITGTGNMILNAMKTGTGEGHLGCVASRGRLTILIAGAMTPE